MTTSTLSTADLQGRQLLQDHSNKEMLRFITCGSVDDGKSTLIGRLLLEAGAVYDDQLTALQRDSEKHGTTGDEIDTALLLDGLEDERQQGITIDVAYRYFSTAKRKFIIADTPGHEQFTRNMATGASTANLALILVDASKGILTQTKRHAFIVSLLGIKHVVLAVNKMDLVDYDQAVFKKICSDFQEFSANLDVRDIRFLPLSALKGDNVASSSSRMPWYQDGSLLHLLENIYIAADENRRDFRLPVQWVNRPHADFRGFCGSIASGTLRVGDEIVVLPSKKKTRIRQILSYDQELQEASAPQSVTVTLADEIDVARGDMIVRPGNQPQVRREAEAMLVWMSERPLQPGRSYWVKHTTKRTAGEIQHVRYSINVNTLHRSAAMTLQLNEIGRCKLSLRDPLMFDDYERNRETGSFILVDRISHETVAAGMLLANNDDSEDGGRSDDQPAGSRLIRAVSHISIKQRAQQYGHQPSTLLISGLCGSGKTRLALELEKRLFEENKKCLLLDGQTMRFGSSRDLGFSADESSENLRRAADIATTLNDSGLICIAAFVAPHEDVRQQVRQRIGADRFLHVHLSTPVDVCRQRDQTGRYDAAEAGAIVNFPGISFAYEPPTGADLVISNDDQLPESAANDVLDLLRSRIGI